MKHCTDWGQELPGHYDSTTCSRPGGAETDLDTGDTRHEDMMSTPWKKKTDRSDVVAVLTKKKKEYINLITIITIHRLSDRVDSVSPLQVIP